MNDPLISVVIPCHNGAESLHDCVRSVLSQEMTREIILVDDGSTDDSVERSRALQRDVALDMFIVSQRNAGPAAARNTGARMARGKYLCFLDIDDEYAPGFFASMVPILEKDPTVIAVFCELELVNLHRPVEPWHREAMEKTQPSNMLMRTNVFRAIGGFPEHQAFRGQAAGEDGAFRMQLKKRGKIVKVPKPLFKYRVRAGSHFDFFLDRTTLDNGKIQFSTFSAEEQDGSFGAALKEYGRSVNERIMAQAADLLRTSTDTNLNFCRLAQRFEAVEGYLHPAEGFALYSLARTWPVAGATVEIGSFKGLSTCWLATGCQEGRYGKVVAVDHFQSAQKYKANGSSPDEDLADSDSMLAAFRSNLKQQKLTAHVTERVGSSVESAATWSGPIRLLFIDGDPSYESVSQDFSAWSPFVSEGGLVIFHDVHASPEVTRLYAEVCAQDGSWKELLRCRTLGILQRTGPPPGATATPQLVASSGESAKSRRKSKLEEEERRLREVVQKNPRQTDALFHLARILEERKSWDEAIAVGRQLIQLQPDHADGLICLGIALANRQCFAEVMEHFQTVIRLEPGRASAFHNLAVACSDQDLQEEALRYFDEAIRVDPKHAEAHKGKSMALLKLGQFAEGWAEYEWRWRCKDMTPLRTPRPLWDGSSLAGKTILLHCEQGIGDTFHFVRYAARVKAKGGTVLLACPSSLTRLLRSCPGIDQLIARKGPLPAHDCHAPLLSLPRIFHTELGTIPQEIPYLHADAARVDAWRREWADTHEFKVGIIWQGNPNHPKDASRSFPLSHFQPLAEVPGVRLFSLQYGKGTEQLVQIAGLFAVTDLRSRLDGAFVEIPAVMKNLDLMICCDSALAHLAGALGVPVWVAIAFAPDWRWLQDREGSPWYPTMRLFRQQAIGDWPDVFARMTEALSHEVQKAKAIDGAAQAYRFSDQEPNPEGTTSASFDQQPVHQVPGSSATPQEAPELRRQIALAQKHFQAKEFRKCEQLAEQIVDEHPYCAIAWYLLAVAQQSQGKMSQAVASFRRLIQENPGHAEGHAGLGIALCRLDQLQEGEKCLREAIRLQPTHAKAHNNLGVLLAETGRRAEALVCWQETVRLDPKYAEGHFNIAMGLVENGRAEEAITHYEEALALRPDYPEAYCNLGLLFIEQGRPSEAIVLLEHAIRLREDFIDAYNNLGMALADLGRSEEALACYREALRRRPKYPEAYNNLGTALAAMGRTEEALAAFAHALRLRPNYPEAHWHQALTWLQHGDMARGWPQYEWRWKRKRARPRRFSQSLWDGSSLEGKTIFLWCEQGLGDSLQFIRYASFVKARGASKVLVECRETLLTMFAECAGIDQLVPEKSALPSFDVQAPLLSLPWIFGTLLHTIPAQVPYLQVDPARKEKWREELHAAIDGSNSSPSRTLKVGIIWQGNPKHRWDRHRSFPLAHFHRLARVDGVRLFSLQKDAGEERLAGYSPHLPLINLGNRLTDFADTAAIMQNLDLVITCDSSPAHLAGALGLPVWVPMSAMSDWRWLVQRDDSPWYPTMRLFRQMKLGDWNDVFERIETEVKGLVASRRKHLEQKID